MTPLFIFNIHTMYFSVNDKQTNKRDMIEGLQRKPQNLVEKMTIREYLSLKQ